MCDSGSAAGRSGRADSETAALHAQSVRGPPRPRPDPERSMRACTPRGPLK